MRSLSLSLLVLSACFQAVGEPTDGGGSGGGGAGSGGGGAGGAGGGEVGCQVDLDCGRGFICEPCPGRAPACVPGCRNDGQCPRPLICHTTVQCNSCPCPSGVCAPSVCIDADRDGYVSGAGVGCTGKKSGDCDDTDSRVNPGAAEVCSNGRDDDCDGLVDQADSQCSGACGTGLGCNTAWDCNLGQTFCDKFGRAPCCTACPVFDADCAVGFVPAPAGIDPMTGCRVAGCVPANISCPEDYAPVCGTNGQTYGNECELNASQAVLLHVGECVRGEGLDCGASGPGACGTSGELYCRDVCPVCDALVMRCTKVGVCVSDTDCPAGRAPVTCGGGTPASASCTNHACAYSCP